MFTTTTNKELETVHKIGNYKVVITAINLE